MTSFRAMSVYLLVPLAVGACGGSNDSDEGDLGAVSLSVTNAPADATCIRLTVTGTRTVVRTFDVAPGASTVFVVHGLPVGSDTFVGEAFASSCSALTSSSQATWLSDPVAATLQGGVVVPVTLPLRRNGAANIGIDFVEEPDGGGPSGLTCTTVTNVLGCTNDVIPEIGLGPLSAPQCHDQCQAQLTAVGATSGCWVVALDTNCYCRGGIIVTGGTHTGGSCN